MKISIIQVGKTRQKYFIEAEKEYLKRISPNANIQTITLKEQTLPAGNSDAGKKIVKRKEGVEILKKIPENSFVIVLDEGGKQLKSVDFANLLKENRDFSSKNITFIIGGCYGLDESVLKRAELKLSFSKFTFTHEMIRIFLLEQLYRSFCIIKGKTYHY